MAGLIAHALPFAGRFSQCLRHFFGMTLSDSALSQRRQQLGADLFLLIMRETLRNAESRTYTLRNGTSSCSSCARRCDRWLMRH